MTVAPLHTSETHQLPDNGYDSDEANELTSCRRAAATVCPRSSPPHGHRSAFRRRADGNVAAVSHGQHFLTPTAAAAMNNNNN